MKAFLILTAILFPLTVNGQIPTNPPVLNKDTHNDTMFIHRNSGNNSELIKKLLVTKSSPYNKRVIFSQPLKNIKPSEIIQVMCEFQVTNDLNINVMVASQIIFADSPTATAGLEITEANGYNVTPGMHHGVVVKVGTFEVTTSRANSFVNVIIYAASSAVSSNNLLTIDQDYGRLSIIRFLK